MSDYDRIARALDYINRSAERQPGLKDIAAHVHLSPFHFHRLFSRWTGTSPKRYLQTLTLERGKALLDDSRSLLETADTLGLSGGSRLHDHFVQLEAVTPGEYRKRGSGLHIEYGRHQTAFGALFVATTSRGVLRADFLDREDDGVGLSELRQTWPEAAFSENREAAAAIADRMFNAPGPGDGPLSLHVAGTNFQVAVWRALLRIPPGRLASYSQVAAAIGRPGSARAVGNAIGANPVAFVIPCHRVIQQSGALGGYRWGPVRKQAIQLWEAARTGDGMP